MRLVIPRSKKARIAWTSAAAILFLLMAYSAERKLLGEGPAMLAITFAWLVCTVVAAVSLAPSVQNAPHRSITVGRPEIRKTVEGAGEAATGILAAAGGLVAMLITAALVLFVLAGIVGLLLIGVRAIF